MQNAGVVYVIDLGDLLDDYTILINDKNGKYRFYFKCEGIELEVDYGDLNGFDMNGITYDGLLNTVASYGYYMIEETTQSRGSKYVLTHPNISVYKISNSELITEVFEIPAFKAEISKILSKINSELDAVYKAHISSGYNEKDYLEYINY